MEPLIVSRNGRIGLMTSLPKPNITVLDEVVRKDGLVYPLVRCDKLNSTNYGYVKIFSDGDGEIMFSGPNGDGPYIYHREDGPACIDTIGNTIDNVSFTLHTWEIWYKFGKRHREDGPAEYCYKIGTYAWYLNGVRHRAYGPAHITKSQEYDSNLRTHYKKHSDGISDYSWMHNGDNITNQILEYCDENKLNPLKMTQTDYDIFYLKYNSWR